MVPNGHSTTQGLLQRDEVCAVLGVGVDVILERCDFNPLEDTVVVSGSLIEGFGNRYSDIDVFIISREPPESYNKITPLPHNNRYIDAVYVSLKDVGQLIDRIAGVPCVPSDWVSWKCADFGDVDLYHRLLNSIRITDPLDEYWNELGFSRPALAREIAYQSIVAARARWVDAVGAYLDQQYEQACFVGRIGFEHSADAYAALLGETNPSAKWRHARLARLERSERDVLGIASQFKRVCGTFSGDQAQETIRTTGRLLSEVQHLLVHDTFLGLPDLDDPSERYEPTPEHVFKVRASGESTPV